MNKTRLEAISDGVFAIVMTLLVIEIKVPKLEHYSSGELLHNLLELLPLFFALFLSFAILTTYWLTHNFFFTLLAKNVTRKLVNANFIFLALISLIPFSSALLGEYPQSRIAVFIYSLNVLVIGIFNYVLREYILRSAAVHNPKLSEVGLTKKDLFYGTVRIGIVVAGSLLAMLMSFVSTYISLALLVVQVMILVVPGMVSYLVRVCGLERFAPVIEDVDEAIDDITEALSDIVYGMEPQTSTKKRHKK